MWYSFCIKGKHRHGRQPFIQHKSELTCVSKRWKMFNCLLLSLCKLLYNLFLGFFQSSRENMTSLSISFLIISTCRICLRCPFMCKYCHQVYFSKSQIPELIKAWTCIDDYETMEGKIFIWIQYFQNEKGYKLETSIRKQLCKAFH